MARFPIVGIGASAGGVDALEGFFKGLPASPGVALVIVTHLNPERESRLHEVIRHHTNLPVEVAEPDMKVETDHVYVMPPGAVLGLKQGRLQLSRLDPARRERKPVDVFFSALAIDQEEWAAGIVLSGGDADGTLGIKALKERGGLTMAQADDAFGPDHPSMPTSAIATGFVDFPVPVTQMGQRLVEFARSMQAQARNTDAAANDEAALEAARREIYSLLHNQMGHDFSGYKTKTFVRRMQRRMHICRTETPGAYVELLRREPTEVAALFRDLLINVTNFFRDADAFDSLAALVVPKLFEGRRSDDVVRVWVPGCATGEEVFSIGILLREHMETLPEAPRVQIFATDIDDRALDAARAARYPAALLDSVTPERRAKYFIADGGSFVLAKEVRDLCIFSPHSVIRDPPFSRIDLVSCRNLLIYFGVGVQNQVLPTFYFALRPGGYLFLGSAENVGQFDDMFQPVDQKHRIFRRRAGVAPRLRLPLSVERRGGHAAELVERRPPLPGLALRHSVESQILEQFAPPHVVVNRDGDIVFYSARTGKYLEAAAGAPSRHILSSARKGLRLDLRTVLREAVESGGTVRRGRIAIEGDEGRVQSIELTVAPLADRTAGAEPLYLVIFEDQGPSIGREEAPHPPSGGPEGTVRQLEQELREVRERLQSLVEEHETAVEELKASNEELVSVNEELQSTNEELEASKEELQSVNEELNTVNQDLNGKVEALDLANSDLQNLINSTAIGTIFLDSNLRIRNFTPPVARIFNILPSDRGRPITDLSSSLSLPDLGRDLASVVAGGSLVERSLPGAGGKTQYLVRIGPFVNSDGRRTGAVVTFTDVTILARAESHQRLLISELQHRSRNLLAVAQSIAMQTLGDGPAVEAFLERLQALSRVQGPISGTADGEIDLAALVRDELAALSLPENDHVMVAGPPVRLDRDLVQTLALVLHELATNAAKYGALTAKGGRLEVRWSVSGAGGPDARLLLVWRESGVKMPRETPRAGYGRTMIERALAFMPGARSELNFAADGVLCRIETPLRPPGPEAKP